MSGALVSELLIGGALQVPVTDLSLPPPTLKAVPAVLTAVPTLSLLQSTFHLRLLLQRHSVAPVGSIAASFPRSGLHSQTNSYTVNQAPQVHGTPTPAPDFVKSQIKQLQPQPYFHAK